MNSIFESLDYHEYLKNYIDSLPMKGRGFKSSLAHFIGCQTTYISQVLAEKADFSLEQAELFTQYVGHGPEEAHYFLLLVQMKRAGTEALKKYFRNLIETERKKRLNLKERLGVKNLLSKEDQIMYYSSWCYSAIHVILSIKKFQDNKNAIAKTLGLSLKKVSSVLEFLTSVGLAHFEKNQFHIGATRIHLDKESGMLSKHHTNWRMQAIASLENDNEDDLHYSSVVTISEEDVFKIQNILIKSIDDSKKIIRDSPEETVYSFSLDFFKVNK